MTQEEVQLTLQLFRRHFLCIFSYTLLGGIWVYVEMGKARVPEGTLFAFFLIGVAVFDNAYGLIFDRWLIAMTFAALGFRFSEDLFTAVVCGAAAALLFLFIRHASHGGMGGGDIKLAFVMGLWLSWPGIGVALLAAFWLGGAAAAVLLAGKYRERHARIAFGPFLSFGAWVAFLYGRMLWTLIQGY